MNEIKALAARLFQNPDLVKSLANPQALGQLAGLAPGLLPGLLNDENFKALAGLGKTVSTLLAGAGKPAAKPAAPRASPPRARQPSAAATGSNSVRNTAIVSAVSLTAITGAVVAVGTVSAVALSKGRKAHAS
jgi:hypothetical protein